jgi:hypothetical protein
MPHTLATSKHRQSSDMVDFTKARDGLQMKRGLAFCVVPHLDLMPARCAFIPNDFICMSRSGANDARHGASGSSVFAKKITSETLIGRQEICLKQIIITKHSSTKEVRND